MINVVKAELLKLTRPRFLAGTAVLVLAAAVFATVVIFLSAESPGPGVSERGITTDELEGAGGGTEAFGTALSFGGFFVFVVAAAIWASEFSQGTFRTLLMKQPRRLALLAGKLAALLVFAAVMLLVAEVVMFFASLGFAPVEDVSTSEWFSSDSIVEGAENYGTALFWVGAWSTFAMTLGVLIRSIPITLAVGIGWFGPIEHITSESWNAATSWYPGLLLERLVLGGTSEVSFERAIAMVTGYAAVAAVLAAMTFARRDLAAS